MEKFKFFIITLFIISLSSVNSFAKVAPLKNIKTLVAISGVATALCFQNLKRLEKEIKKTEKLSNGVVLPKVLYRATSYDNSMRLVNSLAVSATITSLKIPKNIPGIISFANFGVYIGYLKSTKNKLRPHGLGTFYPGIKFLFDTDNFMNLSSENIEITNHIGELMDPRYIDVIDASGNLVEDFNEMPFEKIEGEFKNGKLIIKIGKIREVIYLDGFQGVERKFQTTGKGSLSKKYFNCEKNSSSGECVLTPEGKAAMALAAINATSGGDGGM